MAIKFFLAELFKKNLLGGGATLPPPTKIGLFLLEHLSSSEFKLSSSE